MGHLGLGLKHGKREVPEEVADQSAELEVSEPFCKGGGVLHVEEHENALFFPGLMVVPEHPPLEDSRAEFLGQREHEPHGQDHQKTCRQGRAGTMGS